MGGVFGKTNKQTTSKAGKGDASYKKTFMANFGTMAGGVASGLVSAAVTAATTYAGFKAAGPVGAAGGLAIGTTSAEGAKAATSSFFDYRKARKEAAAVSGASGGSSIGGSISVSQVKQLAVSIATKVAEGDSKLMLGMSKIEEAIQLVNLATDGSTSEKAAAIYTSIGQALETAGETQKLAVSAKGQITTWMGKV